MSKLFFHHNFAIYLAEKYQGVTKKAKDLHFSMDSTMN